VHSALGSRRTDSGRLFVVVVAESEQADSIGRSA
jgi:hypothetical protein